MNLLTNAFTTFYGSLCKSVIRFVQYMYNSSFLQTLDLYSLLMTPSLSLCVSLSLSHRLYKINVYIYLWFTYTTTMPDRGLYHLLVRRYLKYHRQRNLPNSLILVVHVHIGAFINCDIVHISLEMLVPIHEPDGNSIRRSLNWSIGPLLVLNTIHGSS